MVVVVHGFVVPQYQQCYYYKDSFSTSTLPTRKFPQHQSTILSRRLHPIHLPSLFLSSTSTLSISSNSNNNTSSTVSLQKYPNSTNDSLESSELDLTLDLDPTSCLSPALLEQIHAIVKERAKARWEGRYDQADQLKVELTRQVKLPLPEMTLVLQDLPRSQGGGSTWKLSYHPLLGQQAQTEEREEGAFDVEEETSSTSSNRNNKNEKDLASILQLARTALGLAASLGSKTTDKSEAAQIQQQFSTIVQQVKTSLCQWSAIQYQFFGASSSPKLLSLKDLSMFRQQQQGWIHVETSLTGRKAADAAFWFALAGITDSNLYDALAWVQVKELKRFGVTSVTCRPKDIYQIMDRFAVAGLQSPDSLHVAAALELERVAYECLQSKQPNEPSSPKLSASSSSLLDLHSDRCLLMLWKLSARQTKQPFILLQAAQNEVQWQDQQRSDDAGDNDANDSIVADDEGMDLMEITTSDDETLSAATIASAADLASSQRPTTATRDHAYSWEAYFKDPTRPLVIDIGCGMGISLLGLASLSLLDHDTKNSTNSTEDTNFEQMSMSGYGCCNDEVAHPYGDFSGCNFLGVDLSGLAIGYAQGIAQRWGLSDRLHFCRESAEDLLELVRDNYPGPVELCMIQFPTPYRLQKGGGTTANDEGDNDGDGSSSTASPPSDRGGNSQLPTSALDGFMVSPELLRIAHAVLSNHHRPHNDGNDCNKGVSGGKLLLQSNCEDVAVWMQKTALEEGFECVPVPNVFRVKEAAQLDNDNDDIDSSETRAKDVTRNLPQRTQHWIAMGGERACGEYWSSVPWLPRKASTETEVACRLNETPIHRCLLAVPAKATNMQ